MAAPQDRLRHDTWRSSPWLQLLCVALVIGPFYGLAILSGVETLQSGEFQLPPAMDLLWQALLLLVIFGGLAVVLHRYVCGEALKTLQPGAGSLLTDIAEGLGLFGLLLASVIALNLLLWQIRGESYVSGAVSEIARALASDPAYLAVMLGPVIWLQAALLEELTRAFMLLRLWRAFPGRTAQLVSVFAGAVLFGFAHLYQGLEAIPAISLIGLVLGIYYYKRGRLLPLILAHGLFDSLVLLAAWFIATNAPEMLK